MVMQMGGVRMSHAWVVHPTNRRAHFYRSIAIDMGAAWWCFAKVREETTYKEAKLAYQYCVPPKNVMGTKPVKSKRGRQEGDGTENVINCRKLSWQFYDDVFFPVPFPPSPVGFHRKNHQYEWFCFFFFRKIIIGPGEGEHFATMPSSLYRYEDLISQKWNGFVI